MYKRFFYIIGFCLCLLQTKAQTANTLKGDAKSLINSIELQAKSIDKDAGLDSICKAKTLKFIKLISKKENDLSDSQAIKSITDSCSSFITFAKKKCKNGATIRVIASADKLKNTLVKLVASLKPGPGVIPNEPIRIKIKLLDSATQITVNGTVSVKLGDSLIKVDAPKNDSGYFEVLVVPDSIYSINAEATGYSPVNTEFTALPGKTEFDMLMHRNSLPPSVFFNAENATLLLLIAVSVLFVITLIVFILSINIRKNLHLANAKISDLSDQINNTRQAMKEDDENTTVPQPADETAATVPVEIIPEINETAAITEQTEPVIDKPDIKPYFICELMVTAGPRKDDFEDVDLGEDVCGFISNSNEALVWVLDGTSDADRQVRLNNSSATGENSTAHKKDIVYFSSRLLAQSIGNKIKKSFAQKTTEPLEEIMNKIINEVKEDWQKTFDELPVDDKEELEKAVKHKSSIQCSTTVLLARLSINGELTAYRVGDSKMLVFENTALTGVHLVDTELQEKNEEQNDRIFFSLQLNKSNESIRFISNNDEKKLKYTTTSKKNVSTIISFSDGIGITTQNYLKKEYNNNPELARKEIMYQQQATEDDKSICFIEIRQTS